MIAPLQKTLVAMALISAAVLTTALAASQPSWAGDTPAAKNAYLYIGWPNEGEVLNSRRFRVWFGLRNAGIAPAGVAKPNTGHHHLIIDAPLPPFDEEIPSDKNHLHLGAGQTEAIVELSPGTHTLQLLFADHDHIPHNPPIFSPVRTITVR